MELKIKIESNKVMNGFETYCIFYGSLAHRCGYVVIPENKIILINDDLVNNLYVHGGITHTGKFSDDRLGNKYSIGFDCLHCEDIPDKKTAFNYFEYSDDEKHALNYFCLSMDSGEIRTQEYVEQELEDLTKQLKEMLFEVK